MPGSGTAMRSLWTGGKSYPQPVDSGQNQSLTRKPGDSGVRFTLFRPGQIGQERAVPNIHRANRLLNPINKSLYFD
jgi:hypothetical protein